VGAIASVLAALAGLSDAHAQGLRREGRALEFRTDLPWAILALEGDEDIVGVSPLRVPGPLAGDFWLRAGGAGVETERGRVRVELDEAGSRLESWGSIPLRETLMRGLLFPGYAQHRYGEKGKGAFLLVSGLTGLGLTTWAQLEFWDEEDALVELEQRFAATGVGAEREALQEQLGDAREEKTAAADRRMLFLGATAAVWGVSLLDAVAFSPDFHVSGADESTLALALHRKTRLDAMLRSTLFPGLGQAYNGRRNKAVLVGLAAASAGAWLLHEQDAYNGAVSDFRKVRARYEGEASIDERAALLNQQKALYDEVEDAGTDRDVALAILTGVWALSLLDTALDFGEAWGDVPVEARVGLGPGGEGTVTAQMRF
jgi:hypothetical protein